jgi:PST family polysaccharide transporter
MSIVCNPPEPAESEQPTYGQILKSSALVGGSSAVNIAVGIVRTKAMAVLLGPAGVGLFGLYSSIADLTLSIAEMGINSSGVRQIAEAVGSNSRERIARTGIVLRRTSFVLGLIGAAMLVALSAPISILTFGDKRHAGAVCLLAIAVFCRLVSAGQGALIQGMRHIGDLAKMGILGAVFGTLATIPLVYVLREKGIVPSLIVVGATTIGTSWRYSRKVQIQAISITSSEVRVEALALLKLGFAFMASGLMMMGTAYVVRVIILRKLGYEATGFYQSAWTLGGLYLGFILQAMGADFYPRLTAQANNNVACNRMVNEQARVGLLLAGPGVIATLTFAPLVIALFYSSKFAAALELLRWICLGVTLRVITWPIGYIILAKGNQTLFFWSELAWTIVNLALTWISVAYFGLAGAGIAFCGSYVFHGCLIYGIVSSLSGFRWSNDNRETGLVFLCMIAVVFCGFHVLPYALAICLGAALGSLAAVYSTRVLLTLVSIDMFPRPLRYVLSRMTARSGRAVKQPDASGRV